MNEKEWECSKCGKQYTFKEFCNLHLEWKDKNKPEFGKYATCTCENKFGIEKWNLKTYIKNYPNIFLSWMYPTIEISTVHLELNHFGNWYETMVFTKKKWCSFLSIDIDYQMRYKTKKEAVAGHNKVIKDVKEFIK